MRKHLKGTSMIKKKNREDTENINKEICDNCSSTVFTINGIYLVCDTCSSVIREYKNNDINREIELLPNTKTRTSVCGNGKLSRDMQRMYTYMWIPTDERSINNVYKEIYDKISGHLDIINRHNTQKKTIKGLALKIATLYKQVLKYGKVRRNPLKTGILAICFHYVSKENYNIINKTCRINKEFRKLVNRVPITLLDMIEKIDYKFASIKRKDILRLKRIIRRIQDLPIVINNTPRPVISGILLNYSIFYGMTDTINVTTIEKSLSVSTSSINKYSNRLSHVIYGFGTRYYSTTKK
jgi:hypothetical protein